MPLQNNQLIHTKHRVKIDNNFESLKVLRQDCFGLDQSLDPVINKHPITRNFVE